MVRKAVGSLVERWDSSVITCRKELTSGFQKLTFHPWLCPQHPIMHFKLFCIGPASHFLSNQKTKWQIAWSVCPLVWLSQRLVATVTHWWWKLWNIMLQISLHASTLYPKMCALKCFIFYFFIFHNLPFREKWNGPKNKYFFEHLILYVPISYSIVSYCFTLLHTGVSVSLPQHVIPLWLSKRYKHLSEPFR